MLEIKVKYFGEAQKLEKYAIGDWIDLRSAVDIKLKKGEYSPIPLNVAMELPDGYEAIVAPRSSTFKNFGIVMANSIGVIDESYNGDNDQWNFVAIAMRDTEIHKGDRICQFRIIKHQPEIRFEEVEHLRNKDRGGFGTSGVR